MIGSAQRTFRRPGHVLSTAKGRAHDQTIPQTDPGLPHTTGPMDSVRGRKLLIFRDVQNELGFQVNERLLKQIFEQNCRSCRFYCFTSNVNEAKNLENLGHRCFVKTPTVVRVPLGQKTDFNCDTLKTNLCVHFVSHSPSDAAVGLMTGDGPMVCNDLLTDYFDLYEKVLGLKPRDIFTISIREKTSQQILQDPRIKGHIFLGQDVLTRVSANTPTWWQPVSPRPTASGNRRIRDPKSLWRL
jgi:hypothetical protein